MDIHDGTFTKYTIIRIPSASDTRVRAIDGYRLVGTYTPSPPGALVNGYILCWPQFFVEPPFGYTTVAYPLSALEIRRGRMQSWGIWPLVR